MNCKRGQKVQVRLTPVEWPYPYTVVHTVAGLARQVKTYRGFDGLGGGPYYHAERGVRGYPPDLFTHRPNLRQ